MERYLIIKTRDELLRIKIGQILYFEADRNYTKLLLSNGIQFTFAINIGKIEEILEKQVEGCNKILMRVGKSHIINKNHILQINLPKQKLLLLTEEGKPRELIISKDPLKVLKESLEKEMGKPEEPKEVKAEDNDFIVNDPHVSRHHACLVREDHGCWLLEDLGSTNGTFVNGSQIVKKRITPTDKIILGTGYVLNLTEALKYNYDYSEEFAALKKVYDDYVQEKVKIQSTNQFKTRLFQSLPFALPGVIGVVIGFLGKGSPEFLAISLFITICAPTIGIYLGAKQASKTPQQLQDIANRFKIDYVCPKCGTFLGEIPWESLRNRKQCPVSSCKAKWVSE